MGHLCLATIRPSISRSLIDLAAWLPLATSLNFITSGVSKHYVATGIGYDPQATHDANGNPYIRRTVADLPCEGEPALMCIDIDGGPWRHLGASTCGDHRRTARLGGVQMCCDIQHIFTLSYPPKFGHCRKLRFVVC